jgi:hypothetical protein
MPWSDRPGYSVRLEQFDTDEYAGVAELSIYSVDINGGREAIDPPLTASEIRRLAEALLAIAQVST